MLSFHPISENVSRKVLKLALKYDNGHLSRNLIWRLMNIVKDLLFDLGDYEGPVLCLTSIDPVWVKLDSLSQSQFKT